MTESSLKVAFKEWAAVVEALGDGQQSIILRKGGIHEKGGQFSPEHSSFLLFPTFEHQNKEDLRPEFWNFLEKENEWKASARDKIPFKYFAKLEKSWEINDFERLSNLSFSHIWSEKALRKRFEYGKEKNVFLMLVRMFRLPVISSIEHRPSYGGCKSWVTLQNEVSIKNSAPVISDIAFSKLRESLEKRIAE